MKTGGLGDVMYALPRALIKQNCDVKVILPRYKCIPWKYQEKMVYRGEFQMDLCADGRSFYVGIMEYVWDGVVYDFIDNEEFFSSGNPYTNLVDDIPKFCYFAKAALAALNYMDWIPDVIHCHDWQAALVPVYLRTLFAGTPIGGAKTMLTIHNLRFQGVYNIPTIKYWTNLPDYVFNKDALKQGYGRQHAQGRPDLCRHDHHRQQHLRRRDPDALLRREPGRAPALSLRQAPGHRQRHRRGALGQPHRQAAGGGL